MPKRMKSLLWILCVVSANASAGGGKPRSVPRERRAQVRKIILDARVPNLAHGGMTFTKGSIQSIKSKLSAADLPVLLELRKIGIDSKMILSDDSIAGGGAEAAIVSFCQAGLDALLADDKDFLKQIPSHQTIENFIFAQDCPMGVRLKAAGLMDQELHYKPGTTAQSYGLTKPD